MRKFIQNQRAGASAIIVVVVVGSAAILMALSAARLGLGELEMSYIAQKSDETFYLADGCAEEALQRLRLDANYAGETLNLSNGSCIISIIADGSNRIITVSANVGNYNKKLQVEAVMNGSEVIVNRWKEINL